MTNQEYEKLKTISNNIRKHIINSASVNIPYHFGGSFSIIEILSYFYYKEIDLSKEKADVIRSSYQKDMHVMHYTHYFLNLVISHLRNYVIIKKLVADYKDILI